MDQIGQPHTFPLSVFFSLCFFLSLPLAFPLTHSFSRYGVGLNAERVSKESARQMMYMGTFCVQVGVLLGLRGSESPVLSLGVRVEKWPKSRSNPVVYQIRQQPNSQPQNAER